MRSVPPRSTAVQVLAVIGMFALGPLLGVQLALSLTPESELIQFVSMFAFGLVFMGGSILWMGLGIVTVVGKVLMALVRGSRPGSDRLDSGAQLVPPGYRAFLVLGLVMGAGVGLLAGIVSDLSVLSGLGSWMLAGGLYGYALRTAAHTGYLPFPEPE